MIVTVGEVLAVLDAVEPGPLRHAASFRLTVAGSPDPAPLARLGPSEVIVKRGARGCVAQVAGLRLTCDARPVRVVDAVGAGDAFAAGYLAERVAGHEPGAALRTAVTAGAFAVTRHGDWEGLPRRAELTLLDEEDGSVFR